jgi:hypothetical protein
MSSPELPPASRSPSSSFDFGRCFTFLTDDPDWVKKVLIGGAFVLASFHIVGLFFVAGYWSRFVKAVAAGHPRPLPEWDDLGGIFNDGLRVVGLYFICWVGAFLVMLVIACPIGLLFGGLSGLSSSEGPREAMRALGGMGVFFAYALFLLLTFALSLVFPAAVVRVVLKEDLYAGFDYRAVFAFIRLNLGNYLLSLVVFILSNFVAQFGFILCCVGLFPAIFWAYLTLGYAIGETVRLNPASIG